jgi:hypothetical protein
VEVASTLKTAGAFLFLVPNGRPRRDEEGVATAVGAFFFPLPFGQPGLRFSGTPASPEALDTRGDEGAVAAAEAGFFPLPFGRPGFRFSGMPASPDAPAAWGAKEEEAAAEAFAARASKVLLFQLPFGRPRFRDTEDVAPGASTSLSLPSGTLMSLAVESLGDDISRGEGRSGECPAQLTRSVFKEEGQEGSPRHFGNQPPRCAPPRRLPQRIVGGADGTCR